VSKHLDTGIAAHSAFLCNRIPGTLEEIIRVLLCTDDREPRRRPELLRAMIEQTSRLYRAKLA
jgi:hypothetical protein